MSSFNDPAVGLTGFAIDFQAGVAYPFANQRETRNGPPVNNVSLLAGPKVEAPPEIALTSEPFRDNLISLKDRRR